MTGPATPHNGTGPDALEGIGAVSARPQPMHHAIGYLSDLYECPSLERSRACRLPRKHPANWSAVTPVLRSLSIPAPSLARFEIYDLAHRLAPTPVSVPDNRMMAWSGLNGTQKSFERAGAHGRDR